MAAPSSFSMVRMCGHNSGTAAVETLIEERMSRDPIARSCRRPADFAQHARLVPSDCAADRVFSRSSHISDSLKVIA